MVMRGQAARAVVRIYSASGCFDGWARSNAGRAMQLSKIRINVG
jgi:hypothetical protein